MKYNSRRVLCVSALLYIAISLTACSSETASAPVFNLWYQPAAKQSFYRVKQGDTLYSIAWMFGLDYRALAAANRLQPPYRLTVGEKLRMSNVPVGDYQARSRPRSHSSAKVTRPFRQQTPRAVARASKRVAAPRQWVWPARGRIVQGFKPGLAGNAGIDISGQYNESVRAAASGKVVYSGTGVRGYGNLIIIKHNASYLSAYAYNSRLLVKLGDTVRAGQQIALMGRNAGGKPMLHFEIRRDGSPVNPRSYLR